MSHLATFGPFTWKQGDGRGCGLDFVGDPGNQHITFQGSFEDDVFPKVGYVSSLEFFFLHYFTAGNLVRKEVDVLKAIKFEVKNLKQKTPRRYWDT